MKTLLSIDWDFFMPDVAPYDWGHQESELFYEMIWVTRCSSVNLLTGELAVDKMVPDRSLLEEFWGRMVKGKPKQLFISDSHLDLYKVLEKIGPCVIDNYDAHHDFGYSDKFKDVDCGNWALRAWERGLNLSYRLFYPGWRRESPEMEPPVKPSDPKPVSYSLPEMPSHYDYIFICRSSAWTPTWSDPEWMKFIRHWGSPWGIRSVWKQRVVLNPFAEVIRSPGMEKARQMAELSHMKYRQYFDNLIKKGISPDLTIKSPSRRKGAGEQ